MAVKPEQGSPLVTVVLGMAGWAGSCCCPEKLDVPIWQAVWELLADPSSPLSYGTDNHTQNTSRMRQLC